MIEQPMHFHPNETDDKIVDVICSKCNTKVAEIIHDALGQPHLNTDFYKNGSITGR